MAEVTIPEEETVVEEETVLPVVEQPTAESKVISVNFNPLDTRVTTNIDTHEGFFTTDTDAWIVLNIAEMSEPTGQYSLALMNKEDGSIFQRTGDIVKGVAYYKLLQDEIKHAGRWTGQVVITLDNGQTTASRFSFAVSGHILDGKDVRQIVIQDFQTLMAQLNSLKDVTDSELSSLLSSVEAAQVEYETNNTAFESKLTELSTLIEEDVVGLAVDKKYEEMEETYATDLTALKTSDTSLTAQLAQTAKETKKRFLNPYFVEFFASFNKYGLGVPAGYANYTSGKYVLGITGNTGDSFVTVINGNIADAGATSKWACVIKNDYGIFDTNKVLGTDGVNKLTLLSPLKRNITAGLLGNLHDTDLGQHYTELGYYAFAQHIYNTKPRYAERKEVIAQFLDDDTYGKWNINGFRTYNVASSMKTVDNAYRNIGGKALIVYVTDGTKFAEWQENLNGYKGYLEAFIGADVGNVKVEFYLDGVLMETRTSSKEVERHIFPFEYAKTGKIKIVGAGAYPQNIQIGRVSWYVNEKFSQEKLIEPNMKVAYIGDSWGEFHNKATTRELSRLMTADGGTPTVIDFSKGGHTSTYGLVWFDRHIIANKPDVVIIEFFTNDFNSVGGINVGNFTTPEGTQQDMNISSLIQYESNMKKMVDKALENGIQPIVIMPASTNSESQVLSFAAKGNDLWNGNKITNDKPFFQEATIMKVQSSLYEANGETNVVIKGKAVNSSERKGVIVDSDRNLTGGSIQRWSNNGVDKAGILFDGTADVKSVKLSPQQFSMPMNETSRAVLHVMNSAATNGNDELRVVLRLADGSYIIKKVQLTD